MCGTVWRSRHQRYVSPQCTPSLVGDSKCHAVVTSGRESIMPTYDQPTLLTHVDCLTLHGGIGDIVVITKPISSESGILTIMLVHADGDVSTLYSADWKTVKSSGPRT